jgi:hypothetical protein
MIVCNRTGCDHDTQLFGSESVVVDRGEKLLTLRLGGQFMRLDARAFPTPGARSVVVRNGMANGLRRRPIALGPRTWSMIRGELSLTPSVYAAQGELTDLVVFRWRAAGVHAVGVNVWEPLTDSVATLRAIVSTLAPQSGAQKALTVAVVDGVPMTTTPQWLRELCRTPPMRASPAPAAFPPPARPAPTSMSCQRRRASARA